MQEDGKDFDINVTNLYERVGGTAFFLELVENPPKNEDSLRKSASETRSSQIFGIRMRDGHNKKE